MSFFEAVTQGNTGTIAQSWYVTPTDGTNIIGVTAHPMAQNIAQVGGTSVSLGQKPMAASVPVTFASDQNLTLTVGAVYNNQTGTVASGTVPNTLGGSLNVLINQFQWSTLVVNFTPSGAISLGGAFQLQGSTDNVNWTPLTGTRLAVNPGQITTFQTSTLTANTCRYNLSGFPYIRIFTLTAFSGTIGVSYSLTTAAGDEVSFTTAQIVDGSGHALSLTPGQQYAAGSQVSGSCYQSANASFTALPTNLYILPNSSAIGNTMVVALILTGTTMYSGGGLQLDLVTMTDTAGNIYTRTAYDSSTTKLGEAVIFFTGNIRQLDTSQKIGFSVVNTSVLTTITSITLVAQEYLGVTASGATFASGNGIGALSSVSYGATSGTTLTANAPTPPGSTYVLFDLAIISNTLRVTPAITQVSMTSNVCTITCTGTAIPIVAGNFVQFSGLGGATFLNGQSGTVISATVSGGNYLVTLNFTHANYSAVDSSTYVLQTGGRPFFFTPFTPTSSVGIQRQVATPTGIGPGSYVLTSDNSPNTNTFAVGNSSGYDIYSLQLPIAATGNVMLGVTSGGLTLPTQINTTDLGVVTHVANFPTAQVVSGSVTVSGTVAVSNYPVTQAVSGTLAIGNFPSTQPVSGTIAVSNLPATQPISGTIAVSNLPATQPVSGTVAATQSGAWAVAQSGTWTIASTSAASWNSVVIQTLSNTPTACKSSAGVFGGYSIHNPNTVPIYLYWYNSVSITIGSATNLLYMIGLPAGAASNFELVNGIAFSTALYVVASSAPNSSATPTLPLVVTTLYR